VAASDKDDKKTRKQPESIRERAERAIADASKPKKGASADTKAKESKKFGFIKKTSKTSEPKEEKSPRRFHFFPKFIRLSFAEIKLVTWPDARTTFRLSTAVIIFATVFSVLVTLVDYGFGKIFKKVFLNG
jgi:preprotein translocase SecE subunit